jgi:DNA-binding transcriptional regulator GbsR (MarR family)
VNTPGVLFAAKRNIRDVRQTMDKKIKKKIDTLHQRIKNLQQKIAGTKKQLDDPEELKNLEKQLAAAEEELAKIKG